MALKCCQIDRCEKPPRVRGLCAMHYSRQLRGVKIANNTGLTHCVQCGAKFTTRHQVKYCSHKCAVRFLRGTPETRKCATCGVPFATVEHGIFCSSKCRSEDRRARSTRKRVQMRGGQSERFSRREIFERDNWRCQLCGKKVRRNAKPRTPLSPTIDHIIPIARGGSHTRLNTQCAHYLCNVRKKAQLIGQLRLFG